MKGLAPCLLFIGADALASVSLPQLSQKVKYHPRLFRRANPRAESRTGVILGDHLLGPQSSRKAYATHGLYFGGIAYQFGLLILG
jgi:hypothetical protein